MDEKTLWKKCAEFHGHVCGGLAIGFKAALYATDLLGLNFSGDEEVVCVTETDACGVDAIQVILVAIVVKGKALLHCWLEKLRQDLKKEKEHFLSFK